MRFISVPSIIIHASVFDIWIKFSDSVQGGNVEPPCHTQVTGTSFSLALMAVGSDPCQNLLQNRLITTALE